MKRYIVRAFAGHLSAQGKGGYLSTAYALIDTTDPHKDTQVVMVDTSKSVLQQEANRLNRG